MNTSAAKTRSGRVQGIREDGPHIFRGIPCAQPAIGPLPVLSPQVGRTLERSTRGNVF